MNIYLPIEVKVRELEGKTLLAMIAAERGHTVILGEKKDTLKLAQSPHLPPGIVHDKSLTPGEYKIKSFSNLKAHGHLITAQDEESGLLDESFDQFAKRRFSEETVSLADKIFAWGKHDQASLQKIFPDYADKIVATGSPRVDFWRNEFDGYYEGSTGGLKSFILIASNFGFPIDENLFWDRMARLRSAGYFERDPGMERYMYENTAYQFRLLHEFVVMIRRLSTTFPNRKIVVRPHPVESLDAWHKLLGPLPNVIIKREKTISGWIRNASVLIHNGCTSALEAAVSGLPRIAYRPIPHKIEREIPNNTSLHAFSMDEVEEMVSDIMKGVDTKGLSETERTSEKIINQRISSVSDRLAAEKIVDEWDEIGKSANLKTSSAEELIEAKPRESISFKRKLKKQLVEIRDTFTRKPTSQKNEKLLKSTHKFPSLAEEEVQGMTVKIQKTLHRFEKVKTVRFGEKSYIFYTD